jgi:methylthioribose-1-phosphate isomerase
MDHELLRGARPTAVNLGWALDRLLDRFTETRALPAEEVVLAVRREAEAIAHEDREMCRLIGKHGTELIPESGATVLTHCNAGALATGGIGTALAPVYTAHSRGIPVRLFADETRPLLQGARLTAWEATRAGIETTVIADSMAGALMGQGQVSLVLVGADRVAANGDVANKIGTYGLAVLARAHGIPFYVALPRSTFDLSAASGADIPIEERDASEVSGSGKERAVPEEAGVWNPAFDVTPAHLVTAFVTDGGLLRPPFKPAIDGLFRPGPKGRPSGNSEE